MISINKGWQSVDKMIQCVVLGYFYYAKLPIILIKIILNKTDWKAVRDSSYCLSFPSGLVQPQLSWRRPHSDEAQYSIFHLFPLFCTDKLTVFKLFDECVQKILFLLTPTKLFGWLIKINIPLIFTCSRAYVNVNQHGLPFSSLQPPSWKGCRCDICTNPKMSFIMFEKQVSFSFVHAALPHPCKLLALLAQSWPQYCKCSKNPNREAWSECAVIHVTRISE